MSGMMSRVVSPDRGDADGVVFFCYNTVKPWNESQGYRRLILHTDQYMGRHSGYTREQFLSPVRMQDYYDKYMGAGIYGFEEGAQDFIALNRSETLTYGTVEQAIAANRTRLCSFCARRDSITEVVTDDAA